MSTTNDGTALPGPSEGVAANSLESMTATIASILDRLQALDGEIARRAEQANALGVETRGLVMQARDTAIEQGQAVRAEGQANRDAIIVQFAEVLDRLSILLAGRIDAAIEQGQAVRAEGQANRDAIIVQFAAVLDRLSILVAGRSDAAIRQVQQAEGAMLTARDTVLTAVAALADRLEAKISDALVRETSTDPAVRGLFPPIGAQLAAEVDVLGEIQRTAPQSFAFAEAATTAVRAVLPGQDLRPLARLNPSNDGFDWDSYLHLSTIRIVAVLEALKRFGVAGRILDYGAYFGNFSLALRQAGFDVDAVDSFRDYEGCFDRNIDLLRAAGANVFDTSDVSYELTGLAAESYDAALFLGVIEHIPHTPRMVLEGIDRVLKRGGVLLLDTPNLAYVYNRRRLATGASIFPPFADQYITKTPFGGHHREYVADEIHWVIETALGHEMLDFQIYNYSMAGHRRLAGEELTAWRIMEADPTQRELIFAVSRKTR